MNAREAVAVAEAAAPEFGVPASYAAQGAELRIVELVAGAPIRDELPPPGPVFDRKAWVVQFAAGILWVELTVDDDTARIVRVRRSRSAAQAIEAQGNG